MIGCVYASYIIFFSFQLHFFVSQFHFRDGFFLALSLSCFFASLLLSVLSGIFFSIDRLIKLDEMLRHNDNVLESVSVGSLEWLMHEYGSFGWNCKLFGWADKVAIQLIRICIEGKNTQRLDLFRSVFDESFSFWRIVQLLTNRLVIDESFSLPNRLVFELSFSYWRIV